MRTYCLLAVIASLAAPSAAQARLFRQTYGATVPGPDGAGCAWDFHDDYFVPRHCDSARYDLFSACKKGHTRSAACTNLHPVYSGYCTPYTACRYRWRDHVYKVYCGCTPHRCFRGPWRLDQCERGCSPEHGGCCAGSSCHANLDARPHQHASYPPAGGFERPYGGELLNVEPYGGQSLGSIAALPAGMAGGMTGARSGGMGIAPGVGMPAGGGAGLPIPGLGATTPPGPAGSLSIPAGF